MKRGKKRSGGKTDPSHGLAPEEAALVSTLLQEAPAADPASFAEKVPSPKIARALIEQLPLQEAAVPVLLSLRRAFPDKAVHKAFKRVRFRLEKKGLAVPGPSLEEGEGESLLRPAEWEPPAAALSAIDGMGNRGVFIAIPSGPSGYRIGMGILNDTGGMVDFRSGAYGRKRMKELRSAFGQGVGVIVEASLNHAATELERAYALSLEKAAAVPTAYLELRPALIASAGLRERPAVYGVVAEEEGTPGMVTQSQLERLFAHPLLESWIVPPEDIEPLLEAFDRIRNSPIVLTETQELERQKSAKETWMAEHYPDPARIGFQRRLEEMAYVFHQLGEEDGCRLALAAARSMGTAGDSASDPVLLFLVDRSLDIYAEAMRKGGADPPSRIKPADTGLILP